MTEQDYLDYNFHFDLTLTKTMLNKYTIDASKKVQDWYWSALEGDFGDMLRMEHDEHEAKFLTEDSHAHDTSIKFYRTAGRGDPRMWIKNLTKYVEAGDTIRVLYHRDDEQILINKVIGE